MLLVVVLSSIVCSYSWSKILEEEVAIEGKRNEVMNADRNRVRVVFVRRSSRLGSMCLVCMIHARQRKVFQGSRYSLSQMEAVGCAVFYYCSVNGSVLISGVLFSSIEVGWQFQQRSVMSECLADSCVVRTLGNSQDNYLITSDVSERQTNRHC